MKHLRLSLAATVLTMAFSMPAFAGDMYGGIAQPPPPPTATTSDNTASSLSEIALGFMQSVLSLF
jgi:hypothetical protein